MVHMSVVSRFNLCYSTLYLALRNHAQPASFDLPYTCCMLARALFIYQLLSAICYCYTRRTTQMADGRWEMQHVICNICSCQLPTHNAQLIVADPRPAICCQLPLALCFSRQPSSQLAISVLAAPPRPGKTQKKRWVRLPPWPFPPAKTPENRRKQRMSAASGGG